jgi:hypothetical protein
MRSIPARIGRAAALLSMAPAAALAHPGHGMAAPFHWHATDTLGLLLVGGLAALVIWLSRGGK